jgi:hypothetical protein
MRGQEQADPPVVRDLRSNHPDRAQAGGGGVLQRIVDVLRGDVPTPARPARGGGGGQVESDHWRIIASHPDSAHPVTLYVTPYDHLAVQEWEATDSGDAPLYDFKFQFRAAGASTWETVARG